MLRRILQQGVDNGSFDIDSISERAVIVTHALQGFDVPYIRDSLAAQDISKTTMVTYVTDLILNGIKKH